MKQITHKFTLIPPSSITYQRGQSVTFTANPVMLDVIGSRNCSFEQDSKLSEAGHYYECAFKAVAAHQHGSLSRYNGQKAVIRLTLSDGSYLYLGTKSDPLFIRVTPGGGEADIVESDFTLLEPVEY